jgi:hypothetical protein
MLVLETAAGVQYLPDIRGKQSAVSRDVVMPAGPLGFMAHNSWPIRNHAWSEWEAYKGQGRESVILRTNQLQHARYEPGKKRTGVLLSLRSSVRHERSADAFVNAPFPMNEVNSTRHLYPQVILRMQEDVEIRKGGRIERSRPTVPCPPHPKVSILRA